MEGMVESVAMEVGAVDEIKGGLVVGFSPATGDMVGRGLGRGGRSSMIPMIGRISSPLHEFPVPVPSEAATVLVQSHSTPVAPLGSLQGGST